jgi:hypothetical protein
MSDLTNYRGFRQEDFTAENAQRISVIIMPRVGKHPLFPFRDLGEGEKKKFNRIMNEYIQGLGEDWSAKLESDFNQVCDEDLFTPDFKPERLAVPQGGKELLLTEENLTYVDKEEHTKLMRNF